MPVTTMLYVRVNDDVKRRAAEAPALMNLSGEGTGAAVALIRAGAHAGLSE